MRKITKYEELSRFNYGILLGFIETSKKKEEVEKKVDALMEYIKNLLDALKEAEESLEIFKT